MYSYEREQKALKRYVGDSIYELFKKSNAIIAGGAITSIFSDKEINDLDVYFRTFEDMDVFLKNVYGKDVQDDLFADLCSFEVMCLSMTDRSILFSNGGDVKIQVIHFKLFDSVQDVFDSFDFTINMGAYDFSTEQFVLDGRFLADVSRRRLEFNPKTNFPIISMLRVGKYTSRGYNISKKTMFQLGMAVNKLQIDTWDELENQLSGFYGVDVSKLFDKEQTFDMDSAIEMLNEVEDFEHIVELNHPNYREIIKKIYTKFNIPLPTTFYKQVNYKDGKINSVIYKSFVWKLTEENDGGENGLWAFETFAEAKNYSHNGNAVLVLELTSGNTVDGGHGDEVIIKGPVRISKMIMLNGANAPEIPTAFPIVPDLL